MMCPHCGNYRDRQVIDMEAETAKRQNRTKRKEKQEIATPRDTKAKDKIKDKTNDKTGKILEKIPDKPSRKDTHITHVKRPA